MSDVWHANWLSEGVTNWNRRRRKVKFTPDLSNLNFSEFLPPDFRDKPKTSRFFERIDLSGADLSGANLSNLNFGSANFSNSDLSKADLSKSNFGHAKFHQTNLEFVDARQALFGGAQFIETTLEGAKFLGAAAENTLFVGTKTSSVQMNELGGEEGKFIFSSRVAWTDSWKVRSGLLADSGSRKAAKDRRTTKNHYDVFYGTNREPIIEQGALTGFDGNQSPQLRYGLCEVVLPSNRKIGSLGTSMWRKLLNLKRSDSRIDNIVDLNKSLFWMRYLQTVDRMKVNEAPTLFVHGFNNTFENAVIRAAQIGLDLGIGQGIGLFSWPSKGNILEYVADEASAEASKYVLADFIAEFVEHSKAKDINIIAHSMGCRPLLGAVEVLSNGHLDVLEHVDQIILAAADVDAAIMPRLGVKTVQHASRTTSYVCNKDSALFVSKWLHSFPRVGLTPPTFILEGMDTVLVNDSDLGDFAHGYISNSRVVLSDIFNLLKHNLPPQERYSIEEVANGPERYWKLRD